MSNGMLSGLQRKKANRPITTRTMKLMRERERERERERKRENAINIKVV